MNNSINFDQQFVAWKEFISRQNILPSVQPLVLNSWKRCWARINPFQAIHLSQLNSDYLLASQVASFDLISLARPVIEDIYQYLEHSETVIILVNGAGYILDLVGDFEMLEFVQQYGIAPGAQFSESQIGTISFGLAITERVPVQVAGAEHYLQQFHALADAAAPIFDLTGRPVGALGVMTPAWRSHAHTLGLVVAGARAIEGQIQADFLLAEQNSQMAQLNAILEANSEAIFVWNAEYILMHINEAAAKIIDVPTHSLVGRRISEFLSYPQFIREALEKREPLTDVEANIRFGEKSYNCILSLNFAYNSKELKWIIVTLRQEKEVRKLVQHQVGANATLTLDDIPGESPEIRHVHRLVKSAAGAQASILIRGESGTGKNVLASAIHNESPRREGPFLIFACSSVPNELVVGELLGFEVGLTNKRPGGRPSKFELAQSGSLFFQDVDALPLEAQGILLNVLDLGIVQRVGSDRPINVDVRILAATSANMEKLIAQGSFRADLFYRLSSFEISLPPLRERQRDLPLLVDKILKRISKQVNRPLSLSPGVMELLKKYPWPGNIRELEAVLARAAVHAGVSEVIGPMHLPEFIHHPIHRMLQNENMTVAQPFNEIERQALLQAVRLCNGNLTEVAKVLGIGRTTVWRKMKAFNISPDDFRLPNV